MSDFKAKMHQIRFRLRLRPRPRWWSLERSPDPSCDALLLKVEGRAKGRGRIGEGMGREGKEGKREEMRLPTSSILLWPLPILAWNALPQHVRNVPSLSVFRRELKTVLFRSSFRDAIWQRTVLCLRARRSVLICHHVLAATNWILLTLYGGPAAAVR